MFGNGDDSMSGIFSRDKNFIDDLHNNFTKMFQESRPLISLSTSPLSQMNLYYSTIQNKMISKRIQFSMQPCLCPYLSQDLCSKYLNIDIPGSKKIVEVFLSNMDYYRNAMKSSTREIISLAGIKRFLKTGRIDELLDEFYNPLSVEDRVLVMQNWLESITPDSVSFLSSDAFPVQYGLTITTTPSLFTTAFIYEIEALKIRVFSDFFKEKYPEILKAQAYTGSESVLACCDDINACSTDVFYDHISDMNRRLNANAL